MELSAYGETEGTRWLKNYVANEFQIEHIHPTNPCQEAVEEFGAVTDPAIINRLGNLVLVEKPINNPPHASAVTLLMKQLIALMGLDVVIRIQQPITLSDSEPEPDAVVAAGSDEDYFDRHPGADEVLFLIEVSDSSLSFDRTVKLPLYAGEGIPQYWIINVEAKSIEVYSQPRGGKNPNYRKSATYAHGEDVPVIVSGKKRGTIPVDKILR